MHVSHFIFQIILKQVHLFCISAVIAEYDQQFAGQVLMVTIYSFNVSVTK